MSRIDSLKIEGLRNLRQTELTAHPHINHIYGDNGAGKTALLEALYILGRGKSFRSTQTRHLITHDHEYYRLIARLIRGEDSHLLGIEKAAKSHRIRLDGEDVRTLSALANLVPIQIVNSDHFALIDQGPEFRRRFLDFGLFYDDEAFLPTWQRYQHALKNRNAALRDDWDDTHILPWHGLLAQAAEAIDIQRSNYLQRLEEALNLFHQQLGGLQTIHMTYHRGWHAQTPLKTLLDTHLIRDRMLKHTRDGIHRADIRFFCDGHDVAHHFSRGQQKTLICALILAQAKLIAERGGTHPIMLIDDIAAELDEQRQQLLLSFLIDSGAQLFITSINNEPIFTDHDHARFQLCDGQIITQD
ncbi:DNA replication/repair protein RecF [Suttonella sp. R2A3]|uniref:DNA replication/repair protein RecF n=1 Tax=Suttonella sp. R2A3 TaxID=2908648 RepID=UPI001F35ACD3|nr:DNA replication/repair protein RecF [Suttonella sp. R2A3]UJF24834.1 DNA replication/repair protein RecF [Suttonella sp. R2A3]